MSPLYLLPTPSSIVIAVVIAAIVTAIVIVFCCGLSCMQWLAETVVVPVAMEIATINRILSKGATPTVEVGGQSRLTPPLDAISHIAPSFTSPLPHTTHTHAAASVDALRRECKSKGAQVPTLHLVLPYLELTAKQGYLVQRIKGRFLPPA